MREKARFIYISALQHYAYCPRQFALIHIEQVWSDNRYTAEGNLLHERVDSNISEQRGNCRFERSVLIKSDQYKINGIMDLLEIETSPINKTVKYFPVEYKRGKSKTQDWDRIQLCAQALCIEEMRQTIVSEGAIWYWETRRREAVKIDSNLRQITTSIIADAHDLLSLGKTPPPTENIKRCRACSLKDLCEPQSFRHDQSKKYINELFDL
ncbi:MAG: CRISPR-associated protein Cas4 [Pseudomonadota bacterium]